MSDMVWQNRIAIPARLRSRRERRTLFHCRSSLIQSGPNCPDLRGLMGRSRVACPNFSAYILAQKQGTRVVKTAVAAISRGLLCAGHYGLKNANAGKAYPAGGAGRLDAGPRSPARAFAGKGVSAPRRPPSWVGGCLRATRGLGARLRGRRREHLAIFDRSGCRHRAPSHRVSVENASPPPTSGEANHGHRAGFTLPRTCSTINWARHPWKWADI
jgi:hypothetical protein